MAPQQASTIEFTTALANRGRKIAVDQRQLRAISIVNNSQIIESASGKWVVPPQSGNGHYSVGLNGIARCTCHDFDSRGVKCKHIWAVEFTIEKKQNENGSESRP